MELGSQLTNGLKDIMARQYRERMIFLNSPGKLKD
jgi:hypothetical protein